MTRDRERMFDGKFGASVQLVVGSSCGIHSFWTFWMGARGTGYIRFD